MSASLENRPDGKFCWHLVDIIADESECCREKTSSQGGGDWWGRSSCRCKRKDRKENIY